MKKTLILLLILVTSACAHNAPQISADSETAQHLLKDAPPHGYARLYLFDGRIIDGTSEGWIAAHFRADELIDNVNVGALNGADVLIVDVPAGTHTLVWRERSSKAPTSKPLTVTLRSGQRIFVSNDMHTNPPELNPAMIFGAALGGAVGGGIMGAAAADDGETNEPLYIMTVRNNGEEMIQGYDVVLPDQSAVEKLRSHLK